MQMWLSGLRTQLVSMKIEVRCLASLSGLRIWHCRESGIGHRCGSDPELLWLWCRPAATAPIQPLAWEPPYAMRMALKRQEIKYGTNEPIYTTETNSQTWRADLRLPGARGEGVGWKSLEGAVDALHGDITL